MLLNGTFCHGLLSDKMYRKVLFVLFVLCLLCVNGFANPISNRNVGQGAKTPSRRFYFYGPELIPHAAAALSMVVPQPFYGAPQYSHYPQYPQYSEEEEEMEEHEHDHKVPTPLQLITLLGGGGKKQQKKKVKKKNRHKTVKRVKKPGKKCMPFRFRIIKKSDLNNPYYSQMPYGYEDEYFPQNMQNQESASVGFNATRPPEMLNFVYPRYVPLQHTKRYRFSKPKKRFLRPMMFRRPWSQINPWRVASPGKPIKEFILKEPIPGEVGGSPPPSPLFNFYTDNRIPLNYGEEQKNDEQIIVADFGKVTSESSTSTFSTDLHYQGEQWHKSEASSERPTTLRYTSVDYGKYSDYDYYRYGTYTQNQEQSKPYYAKTASNDINSQPTDTYKTYNRNQDQRKPLYVKNTSNDFNYQPTESHTNKNYHSSTERVITVTPTTYWVPVSRIREVSRPITKSVVQSSSKFTSTIAGNTQKNYRSGGFQNLSQDNGTETYSFGDRIVAKQNCTSSSRTNSTNCQSVFSKDYQGAGKFKTKPLRRNGAYTYRNKQEAMEGKANTDTGAALKAKPFSPVRINANNSRKTKLETTLKAGRSYEHEVVEYLNPGNRSDTEIITAEYPQDDVNGIFISLSNASSVRARRSNSGFSALVSGSILVEER